MKGVSHDRVVRLSTVGNLQRGACEIDVVRHSVESTCSRVADAYDASKLRGEDAVEAVADHSLAALRVVEVEDLKAGTKEGYKSSQLTGVSASPLPISVKLALRPSRPDAEISTQ